MNIAYARLGRAIHFNPDHWKPTGGDLNAPKMVNLLANHHPKDKIFIFGRNDLSTCSDEIKAQFKYSNVFDLTEGLTCNEATCESWEYFKLLNEQVKKAKIDYFVILAGPTGDINMPNFITMASAKGKKCQKVLAQNKRMTAPILYVLNDHVEVPKSYYSNDSRYLMTREKELYQANLPSLLLTQFDSPCIDWAETIRCFEDAKPRKLVRTKIPAKYVGLETLFLNYQQKTPIEQIPELAKKKLNQFRIVLNQEDSNGNPDRYPTLMKYIGKWDTPNCIKNVEIYGKWRDEILEADPRFKGPKDMNELAELMKATKISLLITEKWATTKWCETMNGRSIDDPGCIAFMAKEYDTQGHVFPLDHFLRVNPMNFREKIHKVMTDHDFYVKLLIEQNNRLKPEYYDGTFICDIFHADYKRLTGKEWIR
ncbi:MAG TPA: hypothetical protein PLA71_00150 [Saccharofermentans sp.]|nr:hypothetical protein [Saccharofermentans sp.]